LQPRPRVLAPSWQLLKPKKAAKKTVKKKSINLSMKRERRSGPTPAAWRGGLNVSKGANGLNVSKGANDGQMKLMSKDRKTGYTACKLTLRDL
jgi:hypothetical protein